MRILFLDHGKTLGGGQVMAARLLPLLRELGHEIDALVGCGGLDGAPIPNGYHGLRKAMSSGKYDLIYANTPRTAIAAATTRLPFVWHKHHPNLTWAQRITARRARRVISVSHFGAPRGRNVRVIHNGVPAMDAAPATDLPAGQKILMLGRLHPEKGHDIALAALKRLGGDARLIVAGPGEWYLPTDERVVLLGLRKDVAALLKACDVLLCASRCDEGAPLAVLEAQMAGLPIVATRSGGIPELVVENRTAFLVQKQDPVAMAGALERALAVDRRKWALDTIGHALQFSLDGCAHKIARVLAECGEAVPA